jgi:hypothetical protein
VLVLYGRMFSLSYAHSSVGRFMIGFKGGFLGDSIQDFLPLSHGFLRKGSPRRHVEICGEFLIKTHVMLKCYMLGYR